MKTFSKILLAVLGWPLVCLLLVAAWLRRMVKGPLCLGDDVALIYSQVTWDEVWQRPQQYAWLLSETRETIYCCPVQPHNLLFLGGKWRPVRIFYTGKRRLVVLSPLILSGHFKSKLINGINCWLTAKHIKLAYTKDSRIHCLVNTPFALPVLDTLYYNGIVRSQTLRRLVYDVIDDFTVFDWSPAFGKSYDDELMRRADAVIAGTNELAEVRPGVEFVPCGVDFELFSEPQPEPEDIHKLPRPIIGYFGTISERIDLGIIDRIAKAFPEASVVMIGPVHLASQALPKGSNIHYLGLRRHAELPAYAQAFDVALIPFKLTAATLKLNPVKTLEYLAAGRQVVATRLPDLERFYGEIVNIADSPEEFVNCIKRLLESPDKQRTNLGIEMARSASWVAMTEKINEVVFPAGNINQCCAISGAQPL